MQELGKFPNACVNFFCATPFTRRLPPGRQLSQLSTTSYPLLSLCSGSTIHSHKLIRCYSINFPSCPVSVKFTSLLFSCSRNFNCLSDFKLNVLFVPFSLKLPDFSQVMPRESSAFFCRTTSLHFFYEEILQHSQGLVLNSS